MPLPEAFMQELKARNDIAEVVASYVNLRHSGRTYVGLCPFHTEKTPSFNVYSDNGSFYCFGCGAGGDVITFIRRIENLDYMEAIRFLAQRAGIPVPENNVDDGMRRLKARILEINREAARFFYAALNSKEGAEGMEYLRRRALTPQTIRHFGLGWAPASRYSLTRHLAKKGFTQEEMVLANVAFKGRSGQVIDRFASRVMFPIIDLRGNVIAFGGRILTDAKPKYLNTSDTPVFNKGNFLFALNFAKNSANERLILCEGYMDVISMHQAGFTNAVATLGTALTPSQARLMAHYATEVVLSYDADEAGQKATNRAIPILRDAGLLVKVLTIAGGKDPDEYLRTNGENGRIKFKQLLEACGNDVEYRLQKIRQSSNLQSAQGRVAYLTGASAVLSTLENEVEQEVYAGKLAEETGVERSAIMQLVKKNSEKRKKSREQKKFKAFQQQSAGIRDSINPEKAQNLRAASAEEALIAYIVQYPENAKDILERLPSEKFITAFNRRVYRTIMDRMKDEKAISLTDISEDFSVEEIASISKILAKFHDVSVTKKDAQEYIGVIEQEYEKIRIEEAKTAEPQDIQEYLQKLRSQKK
ncbi:MAG: DNA primase [Eubacteriales bacterium]|jgi:DNA primase